MYYQFTPTLCLAEPDHISSDVLTVGYLEADELPQACARFGFFESAALEGLAESESYRNSVDVYEDYTMGLVTIVDVNNVFGKGDRVAFFFKRNLFLMVTLRDTDNSSRELFEQTMRRYKPESVTLEKLIYSLLESTISRDGQALSRIEFEISEMEKQVVHGKATQSLSKEIYMRKRSLLLLRNYYEQLIELGEELQENENDIFADGALHYFALFTARAERLSGYVQMLCDSLNQLREAHQATLDYGLNNTMKLFTVITALFSPLALVVGWYGMNFSNMPELDWQYGYPFVVVLSISIVVVCLVLFKKKKLL